MLAGSAGHMKGNDGRTRVAVPEEALVRPDRPPDSPLDSPSDRPPVISPDNNSIIARLEGNLAGVREALCEARTRSEAAEKRAAEAAELLKTERARADKAIAAFASLAERLDALAAERTKPWWRRLVAG